MGHCDSERMTTLFSFEVTHPSCGHTVHETVRMDDKAIVSEQLMALPLNAFAELHDTALDEGCMVCVQLGPVAEQRADLRKALGPDKYPLMQGAYFMILRLNQGWTISTVASRIGCEAGWWQAVELGMAETPDELWPVIAEALGVDVDALLPYVPGVTTS